MKLINEDKIQESIITRKGRRRLRNRELEEDIVKLPSGKWINKGKSKIHGEFPTKKQAREQQKAIYANKNIDEALYNNEVEEFFKLAKEVGAKTLDDLRRILNEPEAFNDDESKKADIDAMRAYKRAAIGESLSKRVGERSISEQEALIKSAQQTDNKTKNTILLEFETWGLDTEDSFAFEELLDSNVTDNYWKFDIIIRNAIINSIESVFDKSKKPMSYEQTKAFIKTKLGIDLDIDTYNKIMGLTESIHQGQSVSGNLMTFDLRDNGTLIIKDGDIEVFKTKVSNVEQARKQIKDLTGEELKESLEDENEALQPSVEAGLSAELTKLITDEWETIQAYNDTIITANIEEKSDLVNILTDIVNEETNHVGQLEKALEMICPSIENIEQGKEEAEQQLTNLDEIENI